MPGGFRTMARRRRESQGDSFLSRKLWSDHSCGGNQTLAHFGGFFEIHQWDHPLLVASQADGKPYFLPSLASTPIGEPCWTPLLALSTTQGPSKRRASGLQRGCVCPQPELFSASHRGACRSVAASLTH